MIYKGTNYTERINFATYGSECLVRDHLYFQMEQTPADNEKTITRLLLAAGGVAEPRRVAQYLIQNGVGIVR